MQIFHSKLVNYLKPYLIALIILLQVHSVLVALQLSRSISTRTASYLDEVTTLATNLLDARFSTVLTGLKGLAADLNVLLGKEHVSALHQEDRFSIESALRKYDKVWDYTHLFVVGSDGSIVGKCMQDKNWEGVAERAFRTGKPSFGRVSSFESIIYGVPILRDGEVSAVLIAERSSRFAMSMVSSDSFQNKGIALLLDDEGKALFKIYKGVPHKGPLPDVHFLDDKDYILPSAFGPDFTYMKTGHLPFKDPGGETWVLSYSPLRTLPLAIMFVAREDLFMMNIPSLRSQNIFLDFLNFFLVLMFMVDLIVLQRAYQKKLDEVEFTDALTKGNNGPGFSRKAEHLIPHGNYALVALDINKFKYINDKYGVEKANNFLVLTHQVISSQLAKDELCARDNADQFLILLKYQGKEELRRRILAIMDELSQRKSMLDLRHRHGFSAGVYVITDPAKPYYLMRDNATIARQFCKIPPVASCSFFDEAMAAKIRQDADLLNDFSFALENGDLQIWLQPKVNIRTDIVTGCEALVRWNHPALGMLPPSAFLPVLEENGRIMTLDLYVFEEVCRLLSRWDKEGKEILPVSVNLSRLHLHQDHFLDEYLGLMNRYGVDPHWLELELTETLFLESEGSISQTFADIRSYGMRCAIDDFGTGYSSLSLLRNANVDTVKLDRSFFCSASFDEQGKAVINTITQLAAALGLTCVAEGVEDASMVDFLISTDCTQVQGYVYSEPLPVEDFERYAFDSDGCRRFLATHLLDTSLSQKNYVNTVRSRQLRELLSGLGDTAVCIIRRDTREVLFYNDVVEKHSPWIRPGQLCYELWPNTCENCPLNQLTSKRNSFSVNYSPIVNSSADVTVSECMWEDYIPAYVLCAVPHHIDSLDEEELSRLRDTMAVLRKKAQEDDLTSFLGKGRFEEELSRMIQEGREGALIFVDLDSFKQINDNFGHLMGDEVLRNSAERIRQNFRKDDLFGRYGGDEFIIYASGLPRGPFLEDRLRSLSSLLRHPHEHNGTQCAISASIGVAFCPQDGTTYEELVRKADFALYEAKRRGKDQHTFYGECASKDTENIARNEE